MPYNPKSGQATAAFLSIKRRQGLAAAKAFGRKHRKELAAAAKARGGKHRRKKGYMTRDSRGDTIKPGAKRDSAGDVLLPGGRDSRGDTYKR